MKFVIKICLIILVLTNALISKKIQKDKSLELEENERRVNTKENTETNTKTEFMLTHQSQNSFFTQTMVPSTREYVLAAVSFVLEIVAQMGIPVISEQAQQALELKQWSQSCIDGIRFLLPIIKNANKDDPDYVEQKKILRKDYEDYLAEIKSTYIFYYGKDNKYEEVLKNTSVQDVCLLVKDGAKRTDIMQRLQQNFMEVQAFRNGFMFTKVMNKYSKLDKKALHTVWTKLGKRITEDMITNRDHSELNPAQIKSKALEDFNNLLSNKDLGATVCDVKNNELKDFNRFVCYSYIDLEYFKMTAAQKEAKSREIIADITGKFSDLYDQSLAEARIKYEIAENMDCNLSPPSEEQGNLTMILTLFSKFIDIANGADSFIKNCLLPPLQLAREQIDEYKLRKQKSLEEKEVKIERYDEEAVRAEMKKFKTSDLDVKDTSVEDNIKAEVDLESEFFQEEPILELSESNPSNFAYEMMKKCKEHKVGDFVKKFGHAFVKEAKEEVKSMRDNELREYQKDRRKYLAKVSKNYAKFVACPQCYVSKTVVQFGARTAVKTTFVLGKEKIDEIMTDRFRNDHPLLSIGIDVAYDYVKDSSANAAHTKVGNLMDKKSRFKEISGRRNKSLSKSKSKASTKVKTKGQSDFFVERVKFFIKQKTRGILSNKLSKWNYKQFLSENQNLTAEIVGKLTSYYVPFIKKLICGHIVNLITSFFGPGVLKYFFKIKYIYEIISDIYTSYKKEDFVQKWKIFGRAIGKGIKLFSSNGTLLGCKKKK